MDLKEKQIKFLELYEPCRESLVRFSRSMAENYNLAEDLVQETTLKAFDNFEKLDSPQAFKSWLFTIASRLHKRHVWRERLFVPFAKSDEDDTSPEDEIPETHNNPETSYDVQMLRNAMKKLPDKQREAVTMYEILGFSMPEIQEIQGGSLAGVKSRVQRARKTLAKLLETDENRYSESNNFSNRTNGTGSIKKKAGLFFGENMTKAEGLHD